MIDDGGKKRKEEEVSRKSCPVSQIGNQMGDLEREKERKEEEEKGREKESSRSCPHTYRLQYILVKHGSTVITAAMLMVVVDSHNPHTSNYITVGQQECTMCSMRPCMHA